MTSFLRRLLSPRQFELEERILSLLEDVKDNLTQQDIINVRQNIEYNEFGLAFEIIPIQLFEYEVSITSELYERIEKLGKDIGSEERNWKFLKSSIKND